MQVLADWLVQLREHYQDYRWLAAHADQLYRAIETSLNYPPQVNNAIDALIAICPYVFTRSDFRRWSSLLFDALLNAQLLQDNELQMHIWAQMGESYYVAGKHEEALNSFQTALERARHGRTAEMMLSAYIGIIKLQSLRLDTTFSQEFVKEALVLSRQVDDLALQAGLHYALALAYIHRDDTYTALGHGQIAYAAWYKLENSLEMARTAFVLSDVYRTIPHSGQAEYFLELSSSLFTQIEYNPSYCLLAYQEGLLYLANRKFEAAQQWLLMALGEALKLDHSYYIAMSYHSLGIAQTELGQHADAEANLKAALLIWERMENWLQLARGCHALGYLEGIRGNNRYAQDWLREALEHSTRIHEVPLRQGIENLIVETIAELG